MKNDFEEHIERGGGETAVCDLGNVKFTVVFDGSGGGKITHEPDQRESVKLSALGEPETGYFTAGEIDSLRYNAALDGIESVILAHALAGIDISTQEYAGAVQTALDAAANHFDAPDEGDVHGTHIVILDGLDVEPFRYESYNEAMGGLLRLTRSAYREYQKDGVERKVYLVIGGEEEFESEESKED